MSTFTDGWIRTHTSVWPLPHSKRMHVSVASLPHSSSSFRQSDTTRIARSVTHPPNGLASLHQSDLTPLLPIASSHSQIASADSHTSLFFSTSKLDALRHDKMRLAAPISSAEIRATLPAIPSRHRVTDRSRRVLSADRRQVLQFDRCPTRKDLQALSRVSREVKEVAKRLSTQILPEGGVFLIQELLPIQDPGLPFS
jgi:hypothetical protein